MTKTQAYRQRARKYLDQARKLPPGERRTSLVELAQLWHHLAQEHERGSLAEDHPASAVAPESGQPPVQQQQQIQSKKLKEK